MKRGLFLQWEIFLNLLNAFSNPNGLLIEIY